MSGRGRQRGFKESPETLEKKRAAMKAIWDEKKRPKLAPDWADREGWRPFSNRIDFLSPEARHLQTGRISILPPRGEKERRAKEEA